MHGAKYEMISFCNISHLIRNKKHHHRRQQIFFVTVDDDDAGRRLNLCACVCACVVYIVNEANFLENVHRINERIIFAFPCPIAHSLIRQRIIEEKRERER